MHQKAVGMWLHTSALTLSVVQLMSTPGVVRVATQGYVIVQVDGVSKSLQLMCVRVPEVRAVAGTKCHLLTVVWCPNWHHQSVLTSAMEIAGMGFATAATSAASANLDSPASFARLMYVHLHGVVSMVIAQLVTLAVIYRL